MKEKIKKIKYLGLISVIVGLLFSYPLFVFAVTDNQIKSMVKIICSDVYGKAFGGSGTIIRSDGVILTNKHVVEDTSGFCSVGVINSSGDIPSFSYTANIIAMAEYFDIALLAINERKSGFAYEDVYASYANNKRGPILGESIEILGFPSVGGTSITFSKGYVAGQEIITSGYFNTAYKYTKTDALMELGSSGGASFYGDNAFAGIPTAVSVGKINSIGFITPASLVYDYIEYNYGGLNGIPNSGSSIIAPPVETPSKEKLNARPYNSYGISFFTGEDKLTPFRGYANVAATDATPYVEIGYDKFHPAGIDGFYIYWGKNQNASPITEGTYVSFNSLHKGLGGDPKYPISIVEYKPPTLTDSGLYYLRFVSKTKNGIISNINQGSYNYSKTASDESIAKNLKDGDLIRAHGLLDVYIVKFIGNKKFKRLILSPHVFNSYGHLSWDNIKDVSQDALESFKTSTLVRATIAGDPKVFILYPEPQTIEGHGGDVGVKRWIKTEQAFYSLELDWDSIYTINETDRDAYDELPALE